MKRSSWGYVGLSRREDGSTTAEYGMIVALIAAICIAVVALIGSSVGNMFGKADTNLSNSGQSGPSSDINHWGWRR